MEATKRISVLVLGVLVVGALGCQPADQQQATGQPAVDTAAIRSAARSVNRTFEKAVKAGDYERQASLYTADAVVAPPMMPPVEGRDSIRSLLERTIPAGASVKVEERFIEPLGPDRAAVMGITTLTVTPEGAEEPQTSTITFLLLMRRTPDGWQYYREAYNLNQPPESGGGN